MLRGSGRDRRGWRGEIVVCDALQTDGRREGNSEDCQRDDDPQLQKRFGLHYPELTTQDRRASHWCINWHGKDTWSAYLDQV
jgi:hypothetical protein